MTIEILHLSLYPKAGFTVELRYFTTNPNDYECRSLDVTEIQDLIAMQERYGAVAGDELIFGRRLWQWLDGADRVLAGMVRDRMVVAICCGEQFSQLPWEILADERGFLVDRGIVPVRWRGTGRSLICSTRAAKPYQLNLLLMATAPEGGGASLNYEQEEGQIISATERVGLQLVVEESGCLGELEALVKDYGLVEGKPHFDVFHLTGHANIHNGVPVFLTETEEGAVHLAQAEEISGCFGRSFPAVVFLSGCRSGQSGAAAVSMAESLVAAGAGIVLGWGQLVLDSDAIVAAEILYGELAAGTELVGAIAKTVQEMRGRDCKHWHLLRVFVGDELPGALVMARKHRKAQPMVKFAEVEFLDPKGTVKVASRRSFVGRRRVLQACLRSLKGWDHAGVWLHGMGGLGKSSVAARLCDRLPEMKRVVIVGAIDEGNLVSRVGRVLESRELREAVQEPSEELFYRLRSVFSVCEERLLIVLDDFEQNLEPIGDEYRVMAGAAKVLRALVEAIGESGREHRVMVTCRFRVAGWERFCFQPLAGMDDRELDKKRSQLGVMAKIAKAREPEKGQLVEWLGRSETIAAGNPRLLEALDRVLCHGDASELLGKLEEAREEFRSKVLAVELLEMVGAKARGVLARGMVFELAVPRSVFGAVCGEAVERAVDLGLLEVMPRGELRVSRVLGLVCPEDETLIVAAARKLYGVWENEESEERRLEMHRLAIGGKVEDIAVKVNQSLAPNWNRKNRYYETVALCRKTLSITEDREVLHNLAYAEDDLGHIEDCLNHYQRALDLCPDEEQKERATLLHNMAIVLKNQGQVSEAIDLYQQSLEIKKAIGNQQGIAATLHALANVYVNQGKVSEAIDLYQQSLEMTKAIGHQYGIAGTLCMLGQLLAGSNIDVPQGLRYLKQSLELLLPLKSPNARTVQEIIDRIEN